MSRLFPVGESKAIKQSVMKTEYDNIISKKHREILSSRDNYISLVNVNTDVSQKIGVGFDTEKYSYKANSSGQDNLGQILLAIYSFENLKKNYEYYCGGLLLVDELDSTLHPAAQKRLLDFLVEKSLELNLQVFFTTHSQTLLEYINKRNNRALDDEKISNNYLDYSKHSIEIKINPTTNFIKHNLQDTYTGIKRNEKIVVLTEDKVSRWFLEKILEKNEFKYPYNITMPDISIGWTELIKLIKNDYDTFKNHLIFLDPDLSKKENRQELSGLLAGTAYTNYVNKNNGNIFFVELDDNIENIFYQYLFNLEPNDKFYYDKDIEEISLNYDSLRNAGPSTERYKDACTDLEKIKGWFNDNRHIIDIAFDYWYETEKDILENFFKKFNTSFNRILNQL